MGLWTISLTVIICITFALLLLKLLITLTIKWNHSPVCLVGKTAIVTGSNIGIGYYTALDFAKRGARVILACRNQTKAEEAKLKIIEATGNENVTVKILDLSSFESVRRFAKEVNETEDRLDILVNNAGAGFFTNAFTSDGQKPSMQINHFSPFLLTVLLIDLLKKSAPSRIVTVSSNAARIGKVDVNNFNTSSRFFPDFLDYANVKLCNLLFTIELAQKLKGTEVTANVLHPGTIKTNFFNNSPSIFAKISAVGMKLLFQRTEAGAQTTVYVAIAKELKGVSGKFFINCAESGILRSLEDKVLAKSLWDKSEEIVRLTPEEKRCFNV